MHLCGTRLPVPAEAASHITDGASLFISGFTAGYPKLIPAEIAKRAEAGEQIKINIYAGASTGDAVDAVLARAGVVNWRRPYMSDRGMRASINRGEILFKDDHLSGLSAVVRAGDWGPVDVAVVEVAAVTEKGQLVPTLSVGNTPSYVKMAKKVILEVADADPPELEGIHDIYIPEDPPWRMPIPIYRTGDRVGKPYIDLDPDKVVAVVYSQEPDASAYFPSPTRRPCSSRSSFWTSCATKPKRAASPRICPGNPGWATWPTRCSRASRKTTSSTT